MPTDKQIEANRRNSQLSTGPRTPEGKSTARLNAFKHGIFAQAQIIRGEDKAAYEALRDDYVQRFEPAAPEEETLVANLIHYSWSLVRFRKIENYAWNMRLEDPIGNHPVVTAHFYAFKELEFLQRRTNSTHRQFHRDLELLTRLQAARKKAVPAPEPIPESIPENVPQPESPHQTDPLMSPGALASLKPEIGFVPPKLAESRNDPAFPQPEIVARTRSSFNPPPNITEMS